MDPQKPSNTAHSPAKKATAKTDNLPLSTEIPNGGFEAWTQVLGSFFLFFNCWRDSLLELWVYCVLMRLLGGSSAHMECTRHTINYTCF